MLIITDSVVLWKIQKFDWLIPETKWHSCLLNRALWSETRIHSSRVEPENFLIPNQKKNIPLFDRAIICSNNSMLWRTASLFSAEIKITTRVTCVCTSTMTTCKRYLAKFEGFQNMTFSELSLQVHSILMNIYIILTFLGHYSMLKLTWKVIYHWKRQPYFF